MKPTLPLLSALLLAPLAALHADKAPAKTKPATPPEFAPITDDPKLPRVLLIGDSVSVAYTLMVRKELKGIANVHYPAANCGSTKTALGSYGLVRWLPEPNEKWDVIHFNHGLHDLSYRFADDSDKNAKGEYASPTNGARPNVPLEQYEKNLRQIIVRLKQTGAKLIFASTTPVPESDATKYVKDTELPYNEIAKRVMTEECVTWNDLWSLVKPRQAELQIPRNVHFKPGGSAVMAKQVAEEIRKQLPKRNAPSSAARDDAAWLRAHGTLLFHKTGVMNLDIRKRRQPYLDRREKLPADLDALLKSKEVSVTWKADTEWHELVLVTESNELRLSLDGKLLASHRSEGFAHPKKRWFSVLMPSTVWIDDVKI